MQLTILGSGSALPLPGRSPSAQLLQFDHAHYLIDCGEGTQVQLRRHGVWTAKLRAIFISHLHGDHYLGLVGLLWSMQMTGRRKPLYVCGPAGLEALIHIHFEGMQAELTYSLHFVALAEGECYADETLTVEAFPLNHGIECYGFHFVQQAKMRSIRKEMVLDLGLLPHQYLALRSGQDVVLDNGKVLKCEECTVAPPPRKRFAYVTDTRPTTLPETVHNCDLLYHEATFLSTEQDRAVRTNHCTTVEAAHVTRTVGAQRLIIGHFSSRYLDLRPFLTEAQAIFPNTELAEDLLTIEV